MMLSSSVLLTFVSITLKNLEFVVSDDAPREIASCVFEKPCSIPLVEAWFQNSCGKKTDSKIKLPVCKQIQSALGSSSNLPSNVAANDRSKVV